MSTTTASSNSPDSATASSATSSVRPIALGGLIGIGCALVANLVVFAVGNIGAPLQVVAPGDTLAADLPVGAVIGASILPIVVGAIRLWVLERFLANGFRVWTILVVALAVVSIASPAGLDVDTGSKLALGAMHLLVGAAAVVGQTIARRSPA